MSRRETAAEGYEKNTWPVLENLARNQVEAGVHFQCMVSI